VGGILDADIVGWYDNFALGHAADRSTQGQYREIPGVL
jgi:hypothetical protein